MAASGYRPGSAVGITGITNSDQRLGAGYAVSLPLFEGPLDLLLHLIEQEKLDINEISLLAVTDQYLKTIDQLEELAPGALADFLVVASRLLYIKSTRLLPKIVVGEEDDEDSSENLIRHLLEYRQFRRAALELRGREDEGNRLFVRPPTAVDLGEASKKEPEFGELDVALLKKALSRALARIPVLAPQPQIRPYTVTVAERIESVRLLLTTLQQKDENSRQLAFSALLAESTSRIEIIVTFLAVLELVKQREVVARQEDTFGEIMLFVVDEKVATEEGREGSRDETPTQGNGSDDSAPASNPE